MRDTETIVGKRLKLTLAWKAGKIAGIKLDWKADSDAPDFKSPEAAALSKSLADYESGKKVTWPKLPFDFTDVTPFARLVLAELAKVGHGQRASYGELAARCGKPGSARAVGRVMATNPFPLVLPCHRIVGASGKLTGFGPGLPMKEMLLELEGK